MYLKQSIHIDETSASPKRRDSKSENGPELLRSTYAGDENMREVLVEFVSRLPAQVTQLESHIREGRLHDLARAVHQIKGAGGGFGFPEMPDSRPTQSSNSNLAVQ
jgi:hypothetical protein